MPFRPPPRQIRAGAWFVWRVGEVAAQHNSRKRSSCETCQELSAVKSRPSTSSGPVANAPLFRHPVVWLLLIYLLAFAVRVAGLGEPPLSGDEAFSVLLAEQGWGEFLDTLRSTEPNPPLHFTLLKLWMSLAGRGEFAVRFPSAAAGVVVVALTYVLGRRLLGTSVGLVAGLLAAVNPYLVWYSHLARAYSLYLMLTLASLVLGVGLVLHIAHCVNRVDDSQSLHRSYRCLTCWFSYVGVTVLALYTHYFASLFLLIQNLTLLPLLRRRSRVTFHGIRNTHHAPRITHAWLVAQATVLLLFAPWLLLVGPMLLGHEKPWLTYVPPLQALWRILRAFSLGVEPYGAHTRLLVLLFGAVLLGGVVIAWRRRPIAAWVLTGYLFIPLLVTLGVSLMRPVFLERYLIGTLPAYLVLLAGGLVALVWPAARRRKTKYEGRTPLIVPPSFVLRLSSLVILLAAVLLAAATATPYGASISDWRGVARALEQRTAPEDVIVQNYPDPAFAYYYSGPADALVLPRTAPLDRRETDARLRTLLARHRRLWLLPRRDPAWDADGFVERWLEQRARRVAEEEVAGHRLLAYQAVPAEIPGMDAQLNWRLGDLARLVGYSLYPAKVRPGDRLTLTLFWAPLRNTDVAYTVFVHLWDGKTIWGQKDGPPQEGDFPTTDWFPGDLIADTRVVPIDPATPPGRYQLIAGLYRLETGERLPVYDADDQPRGDFVPLATVEVSR